MVMPALFLSHGAPTLLMTPTPAHHFLRGLGQLVPLPRAILVVSAHWQTQGTWLGLGAGTIHDFNGFPAPLYQLQYPAPVAADVAQLALEALAQAGIKAGIDTRRGRDHGVWVPLMLAWPQARIPVVQMSLDAGLDARGLYRVGQALAPLREAGVLVTGSGSSTHNLHGLPSRELEPWASDFMSWLARVLEAGDTEALVDWEALAPAARTNHPTTEHLDPLLVACGAAGGAPAQCLHASWEFGSLGMHAFRFG